MSESEPTDKKIQKGEEAAEVLAHTAEAVLALQKLNPESGYLSAPVTGSCSSCGAGSCF